MAGLPGMAGVPGMPMASPAIGMAAGGYMGGFAPPPPPPITVRKEFPETWMWDTFDDQVLVPLNRFTRV